MSSTNPYNYHRQPLAHAAWERGYQASESENEARIEELIGEIEATRDSLHEACVRFPQVDRWLYGE